MIISLRNGYDQVTNEFDVDSGKCVQSRYFCNVDPPEKFKEPLNILKNRVKRYRGKLKAQEKVKIPLVINGVPVKEEQWGLILPAHLYQPPPVLP